MSWIKKILTKLIEFNLRKIIDCDLTRLGSIMAEAGKWAEQQIRAAIKTESKFKEKTGTENTMRHPVPNGMVARRLINERKFE